MSSKPFGLSSIIHLLMAVDEQYTDLEELLLQIEDEAGIAGLENENGRVNEKRADNAIDSFLSLHYKHRS